MSDDLIQHMRERIKQLRRIKAMAHDPRIIELVDEVIKSGEADVERLEADDRSDGAEP